MASLPKSFSPPRAREYASSMKRMPPKALRICSLVFWAVWPMYSPTRSALSTSTRCPLGRTPSCLKSSPKILATVVLPVPGLPEKIICKTKGSVARATCCRLFWITIKASSSSTNFLTFSRPTREFSLAFACWRAKVGVWSLRLSCPKASSTPSSPLFTLASSSSTDSSRTKTTPVINFYSSPVYVLRRTDVPKAQRI